MIKKYSLILASIILTCLLKPNTLTAQCIAKISPSYPVLCENDTMTLTASGGKTYSWSPGLGIADSTSATIRVIPPGTTTYTVTVTDSLGAKCIDSVTIQVNASHSAPLLGGSGTHCSGTSIQLSADTVTGGTSYIWQGPNGFDSPTEDTTINNATLAASGTYSLIVTANGCVSIYTEQVTINSSPAAPNLISAAHVCTGNSFTLSADSIPGATYIWTFPNTGFICDQRDTIITSASAINNGIYSVSAKVAGCTSALSFDTITVFPVAPLPIISGNNMLCSGDSLNLKAIDTSGVSYSWTGPNSFTSLVQNITIPNIIAADSGIYTVTASFGGCAGTSATIDVAVNPRPTTPILSSNSPVCTGYNLTINTIDSNVSAYSWTGPNGFSSQNQNLVITGITIAGSGVYSVTAVSAMGCASAPATTTVKINSSPTLNITTGNTPCNASSGTATATAGAGSPPYSYLWNNGATNATDSNLATGAYQVTVTDANGCTVSSSAAISTTSGPTVVPTVVNEKCFGDSTGSITLNVTGGGNPLICNWSYPTNTYSCPGATININPTLTNIPAGTYNVSVGSPSGCATQLSITVTQPAAALKATASSVSATCTKPDGSATVIASGGTAPYTYSWNHTTASTASSVNNITAGYYPVTITDNNGCIDSIGVLVTNTNGPTVYTTSTSRFNCVLDSTGAIYTADSGGTSPYTISWSNGETTQNITDAQAGTYYVTATDNNGCIGGTSIKVSEALPVGVSICMVSVDTIQKTTIIWNRSNEAHIAAYNLYRKPTSGTAYQLIKTFCAQSETIYTDSVSNSQVSGYSYEISETDSCGNESPLSPAINSIYMSVTNNVSNVVLNWDPYQGTFGNYYYIYRDTVKNVYVLYDSVPNTILTYTDNKPIISGSAVYYTIGIENLAGCTPTSKINGIADKPGPPPSSYNSAKSNTNKIMPGTPTSIQSFDGLNNLVNIFPNPNTGTFNLLVSNPLKQSNHVSIKITDVTGQLILAEDYAAIYSDLRKQINLSGISKGVYFVQVYNNGIMVNKRLVIQ